MLNQHLSPILSRPTRILWKKYSARLVISSKCKRTAILLVWKSRVVIFYFGSINHFSTQLKSNCLAEINEKLQTIPKTYPKKDFNWSQGALLKILARFVQLFCYKCWKIIVYSFLVVSIVRPRVLQSRTQWPTIHTSVSLN